MSRRIALFLAVSPFVLFGLMWLQVRLDSPSLDRISAYVACQQFVESRLKAPSTADYPPLGTASVTEIRDDTLTIRAYVDAQNSFGGTVRTPFACTVRHVSGDTWRLERLTLTD